MTQGTSSSSNSETSVRKDARSYKSTKMDPMAESEKSKNNASDQKMVGAQLERNSSKEIKSEVEAKSKSNFNDPAKESPASVVLSAVSPKMLRKLRGNLMTPGHGKRLAMFHS